MNKLLRILKNPLVIILPVIAILLLAWHQYTGAESQINTSQVNILPNAGLDELDDIGLPAGWQFSPASSAITAANRAGHESPNLLELTSNSDTSSNTTIASPLAPIKKGETYFYKGFYKSTVPFDLILRTNYKDGSKKLTIAGHYNTNKQWSTVSHTFTADETAQTVQLVYSFSAKGELQIDNNYLEPNPSDVYRNPQKDLTNNLIQNPTLVSQNAINPDSWSISVSGNNATRSSYISTDGNPYLRNKVSLYKDGEAKWQYTPIAARSNQAFQFGVTYRSDTPTDIIAEYVLSSGERQFSTLSTLLPARDWTTYTQQFEAPSGATSVSVSAVLHSNGTLDTKEYSLYDISKPGVATWQRPLGSITFDDGWESAYVSGVPALNQYGYKATFYLNPASIDTTSFITSDEVASLRGSGHELASHGYQHSDFTTLDKSSIDYQLGHAYQYFKQVHRQETVNFSAPFGGTDDQLIHYARKYYSSLRGTDSGLNTRQNFNPYNLLVLYVGRDTSKAKLADALAEAKANNGWLILVYHRVDTDTEGEPVISPQQFQQHLDTLKNSGVTIMPVSAAMQEIGRHEL